MNAGIIAAGEGSRLRLEGVTAPKPLVPVNGVPMIERLIKSFMNAGIAEVFCIINEYSPEVEQFVVKKNFSIPVKFVVKTTPSSVHSLFELAPLLSSGRFLLSTVDPIFDQKEFDAYLDTARRRTDTDGVLAVTPFIDDENPLYVRTNEANRITGFSKKDRSPLVTGGLYVFSPRVFDEIDNALQSGVERLRYFLAHLVTAGYHLEPYVFSKIIDVDHVGDIRVAEQFLHTR